MNLKFLVMIPFLTVCSLLSIAARAEDQATHVSEENAVEARKLLDEGNAAQKTGDWEKAHEAYRHSFSLKRSYDTAANLGQVEFRLEHYRAAAEHLDYSLRHYPTSANRDRHASIKKLLEQASARVGQVRVVVDRPGATIYVNDAPVGASPLDHSLFVETGKNVIRAELDGESDSQEVEADPGQVVELKLLVAEQEDHKAAGFSSSGLGRQSEDSESGTRPRGVHAGHVSLIVGGGLTLGSGIATAVFALQGASMNRKAERRLRDLRDSTTLESPCFENTSTACRELRETLQKRDSSNTTTDIFMVTTGVLAISTGVVSYVLWPKRKRLGTAVHLMPFASPEGSGLWLNGRF